MQHPVCSPTVPCRLARGDWRRTSGFLFHYSPTCFSMKSSLLLIPEFAVYKPQWFSSCCSLTRLEIQTYVTPCPTGFTWVLEIWTWAISGPYACGGSTFKPEQCLQHRFNFLTHPAILLPLIADLCLSFLVLSLWGICQFL